MYSHSILDGASSILFGFAMCLPQAFALPQASAPQVRLEFRLAQNEAGPGLEAATVAPTGELFYLHKEVIITNRDIIEAQARESAFLGRYEVAVVFTKKAAERMAAVTESNVGRFLAILINGKVLSALRIQARVYDKGVISRPMTKREAEDLAEALTEGSAKAAPLIISDFQIDWKRPSDNGEHGGCETRLGWLG
jgi:preprotein translocase subunit SecD